jgi:hypothetical protein
MAKVAAPALGGRLICKEEGKKGEGEGEVEEKTNTVTSDIDTIYPSAKHT